MNMLDIEWENKPSLEQIKAEVEKISKTYWWQTDTEVSDALFEHNCKALVDKYNSMDLIIDKEGKIYIKIQYQTSTSTEKKHNSTEIVPLSKWLKNKEYHIGKWRFRTTFPFTSSEIRDILSKPVTPLQK